MRCFALSDPGDPLVVDIGTLNVGRRATLSFQVTVNKKAGGKTITNQAAAASDQQVPPIYTPPITTPGGGVVVPGSFLYLPAVMRQD